VTPRNVLIAAGGEPITRDRVHIADLGLADVTGSTARIGDLEVAGTPAYISPEQVLGQPVGPTADVYQAGALLYFLVTGQAPYPRSTIAKIIHAHLYAPPPVPSALVRDAVPLDRLVTRALSKQPASRFQSAAEFRAALEHALHDANAGVAAAPAIDATAVLPAASNPARYLTAEPVEHEPEAFRRARSGNPVGIVAALVIGLLVMIPVVQTLLPGAASAVSSVAPSPSSASTVIGVVPRLAGSLQEAQAALVAQGFAVGQVSTRNSSQVEGQLIEQHPEAGSLSPKGSAVDLVIASGRNAVPQLVGLTIATAAAQLKASGFVAAAGQLTSAELVGGSAPASGQVVRVGSTVTLIAGTTVTSTPTPSAAQPSDSAPVSSAPQTSAVTGTTSSLPSTTRTTSASASGGA